MADQRNLAHLVCDCFGCHSSGRVDVWMAAVKRHGPTELRKALSAFRNWRREILAFFDFLPTYLSNGFVEGKNNRTEALVRQRYGCANRRHLRLRSLLEVAQWILTSFTLKDTPLKIGVGLNIFMGAGALQAHELLLANSIFALGMLLSLAQNEHHF